MDNTLKKIKQTRFLMDKRNNKNSNKNNKY